MVVIEGIEDEGNVVVGAEAPPVVVAGADEAPPPVMIGNHYIPNLEDILCRLPAQFLHTAQVVCKAWSYFNRKDWFARMHLEHSRQQRRQISLMAVNDGYDPSFWSMDCDITTGVLTKPTPLDNWLGPNIHFHRMFASLDGLLCYKWMDGRVVVHNPVTRSTRGILPPHLKDPISHLYTAFGFGFDADNNAYKLVCISSYAHSTISEVQVYNLASKVRTTLAPLPYIVRDTNENHLIADGVFVDGNLYWLACVPGNTKDPFRVLAFNLSSEGFTTYAAPDILKDEIGNPLISHIIAVFDDTLCLYRSCRRMQLVLVGRLEVFKLSLGLQITTSVSLFHHYTLNSLLRHYVPIKLNNGLILIKEGWLGSEHSHLWLARIDNGLTGLKVVKPGDKHGLNELKDLMPYIGSLVSIS